MTKVVTLPKPAKGQTLTYLVLSDVHSLYYNETVFKKALKLLSKAKNPRVILLGDIIDCEYLHSKSPAFKFNVKNKNFEDYFAEELQVELDWFEERLQEIKKVVKKWNHIFYAEGNHEERLRRSEFIEKCPHSLRFLFNFFERMSFKERGITYIKYNDAFCITAKSTPNLYLTHGMYCNSTHGKKHFDAYHSNIMYGHTHQREIRPFRALGHTMYSYNNPCLCDLNPKYLNGRITNWTVGFSLIQQTKDHIFVNIIEAQDNEVYDMYGKKVKI